MEENHFRSFEEFWPYYLKEHSLPATRTLHAVGTSVGMGVLLALLARRKWKLLPLALIPGYGAAWLSHLLIERNKPATFDYPLWSFRGDYKMLRLMVSGKMDAELKRLEQETDR